MISENFCTEVFLLSLFFSKNGLAADRPSNMQLEALRLTAGSLVPPSSQFRDSVLGSTAKALVEWLVCHGRD